MDPGRAVGQAARTTRNAVRTVVSPAGLRGAGTEIAWLAAHAVLYPLGVLGERARTSGREQVDRFTLADLAPVQRGLLMGDVVAAGTPILLVHGLVDNRSTFTLLRRALRRKGYGQVLTLNYSPFTQDVRTAALHLQHLVEQTCEQTGYERVHVVGHSLGGVVARYYVQRMGGDARVHTLATLGSPHSGTVAAHLLPTRLARQLRPSSELMAELAEPAPGCRTRFLCFWSDLDHLVVPQHRARLDHPDLAARNVLLRGTGHMSLTFDRRVVREISQLFAHLDEDGSTLTEGVTPIGAGAAAPAAPPPAVRRTSSGSTAAATRFDPQPCRPITSR